MLHHHEADEATISKSMRLPIVHANDRLPTRHAAVPRQATALRVVDARKSRQQYYRTSTRTAFCTIMYVWDCVYVP